MRLLEILADQIVRPGKRSRCLPIPRQIADKRGVPRLRQQDLIRRRTDFLALGDDTEVWLYWKEGVSDWGKLGSLPPGAKIRGR